MLGSKALAFNISICSIYSKAVPVLAPLDTTLQRSPCPIIQWPLLWETEWDSCLYLY